MGRKPRTAEEIVDHLLNDRTGRLGGTVTGPPVDVYGIAASLGVEVVTRTDLPPGVEAELLRGTRVHLIVVRSPCQPARARFSVAHELGHLFLHPDEDFVFQQGQPTGCRYAERPELEANHFAAALLMPEDWLRAAIGEGMSDAGVSFTRIAQRFGVSRQALRRRLAALALTLD